MTLQLSAQKLDSLKRRSILAQVGISQNTFRDGVFSPLLYSGLGFVVFTNYQTENSKQINRFSIKGSTVNTINTFSNKAIQSNISLTYGYFHKFRKHYAWWWGFLSKTQLSYRKFDAAISIGGEGQNADIFSTLNPTLRFQSNSYKWGKISLELGIPIIGVAAARKMYNSNSNPDIIWQSVGESNSHLVLKTIELISFSELKQIDVSVLYQYPINGKTVLSATYLLSGYQYNHLINSSNAINTSLALGICFMFKN